ncbi:MAG: RNA polymerase sigma factor [Salibacteraceae bacterium]
MTNKQKQTYFLQLYEPIHDRFERFCRARVYGDMEHKDLMNESLLLAFQKIDSLQKEDQFLSFLIGISVRLLANNHKKKKENLLPVNAHLEVIDVNAQTDSLSEVYFLYQALALLPAEQKECIILFEISGFSIKEIMQIQDVSESAVKQRLRRGRMRLKEILTFESEHKTTEVKYGNG